MTWSQGGILIPSAGKKIICNFLDWRFDSTSKVQPGAKPGTGEVSNAALLGTAKGKHWAKSAISPRRCDKLFGAFLFSEGSEMLDSKCRALNCKKMFKNLFLDSKVEGRISPHIYLNHCSVHQSWQSDHQKITPAAFRIICHRSLFFRPDFRWPQSCAGLQVKSFKRLNKSVPKIQKRTI